MNYQTIHISISVEAVAKEIYATAALRHSIAPVDSPVPELLTPGHRNALIPVIRASFLRVALDAVGSIESIHPGEDTEMLMPLSVRVPAATTDGAAATMRHAVERAIASATLLTCYAGIDPGAASEFAIHLNRDLDTIRLLMPPAITPPRITPSL